MRKRSVLFGLVLVVAIAAAAGVAFAEENTGGGGLQGKNVSIFDWFMTGGSWVGYVLMGLSVISTGFIIEHFLKVRRSVILPDATEQQVRQMLEAKQYRELVDYTAGDPSLLSVIMHRALQEAPYGFGAMETAMEGALQERQSRLNLKPEVLSILGNTGPLIGLYGTVLGIILAFSDIVKTGGIPDPGQLASSIGVALVATFWGLTVAIPSLVVYSLMKNRIEAYGTDALQTGRELLASFKASSKRSSGESSQSKRPAVPASV